MHAPLTPGAADLRGGGVPGVGGAGGHWEVGIPGQYPAGQIEAYLWNIKLDSVDTAV